jgi:hypothetical protein
MLGLLLLHIPLSGYRVGLMLKSALLLGLGTLEVSPAISKWMCGLLVMGA